MPAAAPPGVQSFAEFASLHAADVQRERMRIVQGLGLVFFVIASPVALVLPRDVRYVALLLMGLPFIAVYHARLDAGTRRVAAERLTPEALDQWEAAWARFRDVHASTYAALRRVTIAVYVVTGAGAFSALLLTPLIKALGALAGAVLVASALVVVQFRLRARVTKSAAAVGLAAREQVEDARRHASGAVILALLTLAAVAWLAAQAALA